MIDQILDPLSPPQRDALGLSDHALISAGAGAGKTRTLVAMIARDLLVDGVRPDEILVCTFTRAAAANLIAQTAALTTTLAGGGSPDVTAMWAGTIDAVCARLIRTHALSIGVAPGFVVATDRELVPARAEAIARALDDLSAADLRTLGEVIDPGGMELAREVYRLHEDCRAAVHDPSRLIIDGGPDEGLREDLISRLETLLDSELAQRKVAGAKLAQDLQAVLEREPDDLSTMRYGRVPDGFTADLDTLRDDLERWRASIASHRTLRWREIIGELVGRFARAFARAKARRELMDFLDITLAAADMLRSGEGAGEFRRVYIDEAQDTNPLQLQILHGLCASDGRVVAVGDAAQSIYAFRRADLAAFRAQARAATAQAALAENHRSQAGVIEVINSVFARVAQMSGDVLVMDACAEPDRGPDGPRVEVALLLDDERAPSARAEAGAAVSAICATRDRMGLANRDVCILCQTNAEATAYADALRTAGVPALLLQRRGLLSQTETLDALAYLRLLQDPADEAALLRTASGIFLGLDDAALSGTLARRGEDSAWEALARAYPDFAQGVAEIRTRADVEPPSGLLLAALERHGADLALEIADPTGARLRNLEHLADLLASFERGEDGPSLPAVLARLDAEIEAGVDEGQSARVPEDIDAVRVMTVHNAKGLEFELVVVGRLSAPSGQSRRVFWVDTQGALGMSAAGIADGVAIACRRDEARLRDEEQQRLLYVAMTRARRALMLCASGTMTQAGAPSWRGAGRWLLPLLGIAEDGPVTAGVRELPPPPGRSEGPLVSVRLLTPEAPRPAPTAGLLTPGAAGDIPAGFDARAPEPVAGPVSYTNLVLWRACGRRRLLENSLHLADVGTERAAGSPQSTGARSLGRRIHAHLARHDWRDPLEVSAAPSDMQPYLAVVGASGLADQILRSDTVTCEWPFRLALDGVTVQGSIDLIARTNGTALVVDWKSGDDADAVFDDDYLLQQRIYALALMRGEDPPDAVELAWLHGDGRIDHQVIARSDADALAQGLAADIAAIVTADAAPAVSDDQPLCAGCPGRIRGCPVAATLRS